MRRPLNRYQEVSLDDIQHVQSLCAGTILVALADDIATKQDLGESHGVLGDVLTLAAAALYACYTILLKQMIPSEAEGDMMAFFGYLGAMNAAVFGPVLVFMQLAGSFDVFAISGRVLGLVFLKGVTPPALHLAWAPDMICRHLHVRQHLHAIMLRAPFVLSAQDVQPCFLPFP